jgi:hypothetical protein
VEDGVCTPQLLDVLLKRARVQMLPYDGPAGAGLQIKQCCAYPANAVMPAWKWGPSGLDTATRRCFHTGSSWLRIGKSVIGIVAVSARRVSHREVSATCAVCSTVSSSSTPMTVVIHGSIGLRGITTLTSHLSWPWVIDMRPR